MLRGATAVRFPPVDDNTKRCLAVFCIRKPFSNTRDKQGPIDKTPAIKQVIRVLLLL